MTTAAPADSASDETASAASPSAPALLEMNASPSAAPNATGVAGPLVPHQRQRRDGHCRQIGRADAAELANVGQCVSVDHGQQCFHDQRIDTAPTGRELIEPDNQHRADPLRRTAFAR